MRARGANSRLTKEAGFSLVELVWAVALLGLVLGSVLLVGNAGSQAHRTGMVAHDVDARLRRTMDEIVGELQSAALQRMSSGLVPLDPLDPDGYTELEFQGSLGVVSGLTQWGPVQHLLLEYEDGEADNDLDDDGDGLIDEGQVVLVRDPGSPTELRTVLCRGVTELLQGETANGLDDNGNGLQDERGFCAALDGDRLVLRLSVAREQRGQLIQRTIESSILPRNTK